MTRFKINRKNDKEDKQVLQVKLDTSLVEEVNLLCKWSGNEKSYVVRELLRFALSQEADFQQYKQTIAKEPVAGTLQPMTEPARKDIASERRPLSQIPLAR
jgi:metal-responsive CopG/Arc/MetJ family transcriptional regulator